jgi:RND family efflux transporter MFP subunit
MEHSPGLRKRITVTAVVVIIAAGLAALSVVHVMSSWKTPPRAKEKIPVSTEVVSVRTLDHVLVLTADIRPFAEVDIFPKVPGKIIERILVEKGDAVRRGELLAVLEERTVNAQLMEARAALALARANRDVIDKDYVRLSNLYAEKAVAKQQLDHIAAQKDSAYAQLDRARAVLNQLEILKADHRMYAPISGFVTARYLDPGALSAPGVPVVHITDESRLKVITGVTEKDLHLIKRGMPCDITADAMPARVFKGVVSLTNQSFNPSTRTLDIEVHINNGEMLLRSGMFAHLTLHLGTETGPAITRDALQKIPGTGNYFVYVVRDERAELRNVETGLACGNSMLITSGLKQGEEVVVVGQNRLKDGVEVVVESRVKGVEDLQ